jgi:hypothetical protein
MTGDEPGWFRRGREAKRLAYGRRRCPAIDGDEAGGRVADAAPVGPRALSAFFVKAVPRA